MTKFGDGMSLDDHLDNLLDEAGMGAGSGNSFWDSAEREAACRWASQTRLSLESSGNVGPFGFKMEADALKALNEKIEAISAALFGDFYAGDPVAKEYLDAALPGRRKTRPESPIPSTLERYYYSAAHGRESEAAHMTRIRAGSKRSTLP